MAGIADANSPSKKRSVRPLSSANEGVQDIAGQSGSSQAATAGEIAVEAEVRIDEDITAREPKVARRPIKPPQAMIQCPLLSAGRLANSCNPASGRPECGLM